MVDLMKENIFQDLVSDLKMKKNEGSEIRDELIKLIGNYVKSLEVADMECDLLVRARAEGGLLESVLRLLLIDRFDPVGCVILAQQDQQNQIINDSVDQVDGLV